jgi:hypothetical protein
MILQAISPSIAGLLGFGMFSLIILLTFVVAYAKRDVSINITILELHK